MKKLTILCLAASMAAAETVTAGGLLTNTNQNVAFLRNPARDAAIAIDGVYSNPAGVAFLGQGHHLSLNWQLAYQTRTIDNSYALFANNVDNGSTERTFKGNAFAPVIPSLQYAYNKGRWSFQANFSLTGGGGKCEFDDGLGSFEKIVSETAMGACQLASGIDKVAGAYLQNPGLRMFSSDAAFGSEGKYSFNSYMRGRQYYYGLSVGAAYKIADNVSAFAGVRAVYASCNYYGYVKDIKVGSMPLYQVLDPTKTESADIELNCDQTGLGFTPILGVDVKLGRVNIAAKYEFKTRMRLKNEAVNRAPSIGALDANLTAAMVQNGIPQTLAQAVMGNENIGAATAQLKAQFNQKLDEAIGEYEEGKKIAADIPALLTLGVEYNPIDPLRVSAGFHWFDDTHATAYNDRHKKLDRGTIEFNLGAEYDACKLLTVSAGWQNTSYGLTDEYMDDKSFVVSSSSLGLGAKVHLSRKMDLNVAYFHTFYKHKETNIEGYKADYTRNNNVFGVGLDIDI